MTLLEGALVACGLLALVAVQLALTNSFYLLHKYFWTDELCTYTLLTDDSLVHAFRALRGSVDINPPGLHILLLLFTRLVGSTSEVAMRSFALLSMLLALVGIYTALRESHGVLVALAAILAVWSHPLILDHAFEVRYYGPWLAAAVWFAVLLARARARRLGTAGTVWLGAASFFLCTVHYFGVVTWLILVAVEWLWERGRPFYARRHLAAIAVGPLATLAAVLFLLPHQRAATTVATWIPPATFADVADFGMTVFLPLYLGAVVIVVWLSRVTAGELDPDRDRRPLPAALVGLTGLALLAPALIAFSFLVQSVLVSRYGLPAVAALAPAIAYALSRVARVWIVLLMVFLIGASAYHLHHSRVQAEDGDRDRQQLIEDIRTRTGTDPVFFEAPHQLNIVWHYAPDLRDRVFLIDFTPGQLGEAVSAFRIWARDLAREFQRFYGAPRLVSWDEVRRAPSVYVVTHPQAYTREPADDERYPSFVMRPVHGQVHQLVRSDGR